MGQIAKTITLSSTLAAFVVAVPSFALQTSISAPTSMAAGDTSRLGEPVADQKAVEALAAALRADLANQPASASAADLEGIIVFTLSQGTYPDVVVSDALNIISVGGSENLTKAITNVRLALLKRKLNRGTAAISNGGYGGGAGTGNGGGFTAPGVSTGGGGSSNYSS